MTSSQFKFKRNPTLFPFEYTFNIYRNLGLNIFYKNISASTFSIIVFSMKNAEMANVLWHN